MGRCLAFNFGPEELKVKLKNARYFVYTPDYDSAGYCSDQYFYAVIDKGSQDFQSFQKSLIEKIQLPNSSLRISAGKEDKVFVMLESLEPKGAITDQQIADVLFADEMLGRLNLKAASFARNQDVVFGDNHILANELSRPFQATGAFHVPRQGQWFVGKNYEEALCKCEANNRK